jgi:acyl-coenzyme A synthetase/AMP-(fatty) acid ligase
MAFADQPWLATYALRFPRAGGAKVDSSARAAGLFTSGSEGTPKAVVIARWQT